MPTQVVYQGRRSVTILEKNASFDQRVVVSYADEGNGTYPGTPGTSFVAAGDNWVLAIQHNDDTGWDLSELQPGPMDVDSASLQQTIHSEDLFGAGGNDFNDLIVKVEMEDPMVDLEVRPYAVNPSTCEMHPDGIFLDLNGVQYMGIRLTNSWGQDFFADTVVNISPVGRQLLQAQGILVLDSWTSHELADTGQQLAGGGILLGSLGVEESRTVYFRVDASNARKGKPPVQVHVYRAGGVPDLNDRRRFEQRPAFVGQASWDGASNEAVLEVPEGTLRMNVRSAVIDVLGWERACRDIQKGLGPAGSKRRRELAELAEAFTAQHCDCETLMRAIQLLCRCLDDGHGRGPRTPDLQRCLERFFWLPAAFDYEVDTGGYVGQFSPLPFDDPWWKVLLILLAIIAAIIAAVAAGTGLGSSNLDRRIGTVGSFSTNNVDAALVELNDSRSFRQSIPDAITGEPNQNPEVALDAIIDINPQVARAFVGMLVVKSGSRTGFTHGVVTSVTASTNQCRGTFDEATSTCTPDPNRPDLLMTNQIRISQDPTFGEPTTDSGDSGSLWLSNEPSSQFQVVALTHSGGNNSSTANPIQEVLTELRVALT